MNLYKVDYLGEKEVKVKQTNTKPDRPIDPNKNPKNYNCAGLAFRDYDFKSKKDTKKKLEGCTSSSKEGKCEDKPFCLKVVFYDIKAVTLTENGKNNIIIYEDFHVVGALGDGGNACSKNGRGPIEGPGAIDSFPPRDFSPRPGVNQKAHYVESWYCCPEK